MDDFFTFWYQGAYPFEFCCDSNLRFTHVLITNTRRDSVQTRRFFRQFVDVFHWTYSQEQLLSSPTSVNCLKLSLHDKRQY